MPKFSHSKSIASLLFVPLVFTLAANGTALADDSRGRGLELFEKHVRPTLVTECIRCHGDKKVQGGLRLDSAAMFSRGGDSGDVLGLDDPAESILMRAISYDDPSLEMPPRGKLPEATIKAFDEWIKLGAPDPRTDAPETALSQGGPPTVQEGRQFWSFQPISDPAIPKVNDRAWPNTTIDRFVLSRIEQAGLKVVDDADRSALARRVYYDLIGLPPTTSQLEAFLNDDSDDALEQLVDRLLDSPQFGERWGRHWLDVVRFSQSSGGGRTLLFPNAWRYRDYVIDSFNRDVPFDQFVREQIAGDLLDSDDWQARRRQLVATTYLLLGPTNYELQDKDVLEMDVVDEQIDTIGKSFLGMTIGCARCHDHKFDPIPAEDYYALAGILKSTKAMIHSNVSVWNKVELPVSPKVEQQLREKDEKLAALQATIKTKTDRLERLGGMPDKKRSKQNRDLDSASISGIVVDDSAAERLGQWTPSTSVGPYVDGKYIHDGTADKGKKSVTFRPDLPAEGSYEVRLVYSPSGNRATKVPVRIHHSAGTSVAIVNQRQRPPIDGVFVSLGVYRFDPEQDVRVVISNDDTTNGVVIADAVVFVPTELPPLPTPEQVDIPANIRFVVQDPSSLEGIVVDDVEAELVGEWKHSIHTPPFVGGSYRHDLKESKGEKSATFTPTLPQAGTYEIRIAHNTNVRRASGVPVTVRHADGETRVEIDEDEEAPIDKLFRSIGSFRFDAGRSGSVTIGTAGTDGKYVIIDAVQFIPVGDQALERQRERRELAAELESLKRKLNALLASGPNRPIAMVTADDDDAGDIPLAIRGVVHNKGPIVPRGVMQVASSQPRPAIAAGESGRRELADWIADPENPLTARVIVNRVWNWVMGQGIVSSVDNFGSMGLPPSHPELLDHLATTFVKNDWSIKQLIRHIMLSRVYRLGTNDHEINATIDPDNTLLWRMNRKRLRAEDIRDTLLFVAGNLDATYGGPNLAAGTKSEYGYQFRSLRRSVYVPVFRNTLPEVFEVFDFADPNIQRGRRTTSTIASQALLLMNHPDVIKQTRAAAARLLEEQSVPEERLIQHIYQQVLCRKPTAEEQQIASEFLRQSDEAPRVTKLALLYQTLLQCIDFRYLK